MFIPWSCMCQRSLIFQNSMNMLTHPVCPAANPHFFHPGRSRLGAVLAHSLAKKDLVTFFPRTAYMPQPAGYGWKITNSQLPLYSFQSQSTDRTKPSKKKGIKQYRTQKREISFFVTTKGFLSRLCITFTSPSATFST